MIICSCNLISDKDVFAAISAGASRPAQIYAHKKCKADCGGCTKQICRLLKETKHSNACQNQHCPNQKNCGHNGETIHQTILQKAASHVLSA